MNLTKVSKYISLILRHKPEVAGITLDEHGWVDVKELTNGISKDYEFNMTILEEIVNPLFSARFIKSFKLFSISFIKYTIKLKL